MGYFAFTDFEVLVVTIQKCNIWSLFQLHAALMNVDDLTMGPKDTLTLKKILPGNYGSESPDQNSEVIFQMCSSIF